MILPISTGYINTNLFSHVHTSDLMLKNIHRIDSFARSRFDGNSEYTNQQTEQLKNENINLKKELQEAQKLVHILTEKFEQVSIQSKLREKKEEIKDLINEVNLKNTELETSHMLLSEKTEELTQLSIEKQNFINEMDELLTCPITQELFIEPVVTPYGHTFEKNAIILWLNSNNTCPLTKKSLLKDQLQTNFVVKQLLEIRNKNL